VNGTINAYYLVLEEMTIPKAVTVMNNKISVVIKNPFKLKINGIFIKWRYLIKYLMANRGEYLEIDGWIFSIDYALIYLTEIKKWEYYTVMGVKDKRILSVSGGCGEDAKYFLEHGACSVHVIESNPICEDYLHYNRILDNRLSYEIKSFNPFIDVVLEINKYDLIKLDIEGYELLLINYLDRINVDIVLESHDNYITDKFMEKGFKLYAPYKNSKEIYGEVIQLYRGKGYIKQ
jgi:hypothetical protein